MLRFGFFVTLLAAVTVFGLLPADAAADGQVTVSLADTFTISPSPGSAEEGTITFSANNNGVLPHNLRVIRTDLAPDALPVVVSIVDEAAVDVVASSSDLPGGTSENVVADLAAGSYVLICNIPGHYQAGMRTAFTVTAAAPPPATTEPSPGETPSTTAPTAAAPTVALPSTGVDAQGSPSTPWLPMTAFGVAGVALAAFGLVRRRQAA